MHLWSSSRCIEKVVLATLYHMNAIPFSYWGCGKVFIKRQIALYHSYTITVVSRVSTHGRLNITRYFGLHGHLPGIKIPYVCMEAATATLEIRYMGAYPGVGACPGHYGKINIATFVNNSESFSTFLYR